MAKRNTGRKHAGLVHLDELTLLRLSQQVYGLNHLDYKYVRISVPHGSEADKKILSNFGSLADDRILRDTVVHYFFRCMYRSLALDIDYFASITSNHDWGKDVVFSVRKGIDL